MPSGSAAHGSDRSQYNPRMHPPGFDLRVLDLDGSLPPQGPLRDGEPRAARPPANLGPAVRMACGLRAYRAFADEVAGRLGGGDRPPLVLFGSGDFHHVTLALLAQAARPFNLLVLDKHPDWVRGVPFLHCGTWLARALRLPHLGRVFHVGGDLDFDNHYAAFAPWRECARAASASSRLVVGSAASAGAGFRTTLCWPSPADRSPTGSTASSTRTGPTSPFGRCT